MGTEGGGATPPREDTSGPPPSTALLGKLRPRAESDPQRRRRGPRGPSRRGSPRRRHISAPARALRGRFSGAPGAAAGRGAPLPSPSAAWAPARAASGSRARRRPAGLPSRHPPGGPAPGGPWRLVCIPGRSDRLGSPSPPARPAESRRWPHPPACPPASAIPALPSGPIAQMATEAPRRSRRPDGGRTRVGCGCRDLVGAWSGSPRVKVGNLLLSRRWAVQEHYVGDQSLFPDLL